LKNGEEQTNRQRYLRLWLGSLKLIKSYAKTNRIFNDHVKFEKIAYKQASVPLLEKSQKKKSKIM
jgi:hypothetical protein